MTAHVFPTFSRDKIGKAVSFPVGAENLSRAFEDVLHVMHRRTARSYDHGQSADVRGVFDPKWSITVFAVPSTLRNGINIILMTHELPNIIYPWLIQNSDIATRTGECSLVLEYVTADKAMRYTTRNALQPERA